MAEEVSETPDTPALELELQRRLESFLGAHAHVGAFFFAAPPPRGMPYSQATLAFQSHLQGITKFFEADARFGKRDPMMMVKGNGGCNVYPLGFLLPIAHLLLETGSAEIATAWLQKVFGTTAATGQLISPLYAKLVETRVELYPNLHLVPTSELPLSNQLTRILDWDGQNYPSPPQVALISTIEESNIWRSPSTAPGPASELTATHYDVALLISTVGPRCVYIAKTWFTYDDLDIEKATGSSEISTSMRSEFIPETTSNNPPLEPDEIATIKRLIVQYLALDPVQKSGLAVPLQRLRQAQLRVSKGDQAIDLCIALESLTGDGGNGELTHKVSNRTARRCATSLVERQSISKTVKRLYGIRSKVVHGGNPQEDPDWAITVQTSLNLCAQMIQQIITDGETPNWKEFDLV